MPSAGQLLGSCASMPQAPLPLCAKLESQRNCGRWRPANMRIIWTWSAIIHLAHGETRGLDAVRIGVSGETASLGPHQTATITVGGLDGTGRKVTLTNSGTGEVVGDRTRGSLARTLPGPRAGPPAERPGPRRRFSFGTAGRFGRPRGRQPVKTISISTQGVFA